MCEYMHKCVCVWVYVCSWWKDVQEQVNKQKNITLAKTQKEGEGMGVRECKYMYGYVCVYLNE